jgi:HlyD family secretion protein
MDIPRPSAARSKRIKRIIYSVVGLVVVASVTFGLSRLKPAAPEVDRATVWVDTVKRGPMLIQMRGLGTLVPEDLLWIPAVTDGRVVKRLLPGIQVKPDTVLVVLRNPQLEQETLDAQWQLKQAEADYNSLKATLDSKLLDQKATAATVKSDYRQAELTADKDTQLVKLGLGADLNRKLSEAKAEELATRNKIEDERVAVLKESIDAQLVAQQAKVEQLRALYNLKKTQLDELTVRAGADGVLQEVPVEPGQQVAAGAILAKVAQPRKLKAQLKIAETQAKDIQIGQKASIDTHNGIIDGTVSRIDPAVQNGTVTVDVALTGTLPNGARPDLSVDGTIEIENLPDVTYVGRPAFGQPESTVSLFKLTDGGKEAVRVQVKLGKSSVNTIQILGGLDIGNEVILSDMSRWDGFDRVRLD